MCKVVDSVTLNIFNFNKSCLFIHNKNLQQPHHRQFKVCYTTTSRAGITANHADVHAWIYHGNKAAWLV